MTVSVHEADGREAAPWLAPEQEHLERGAVRVAVGLLSVARFSPRTSGENLDHVEVLAEAQGEFPPIIVHRPTMGVIDGVHRLQAAKVRGESHIDAYFFNGTEADAFVIAVKANVGHGLPLSLSERKAAAERIVGSHAQWSDRMIASIAGISSATVAQIRRNSGDQSAQGTVRLGHDGRVRPINSAERRILAARLITENPRLSLRQVARAVGISPETVRDVRNRLQLGADPVPQHSGAPPGGSNETPRDGGGEGERPGQAGAALRPVPPPRRDVAAMVERLRKDPALQFNDVGRTLLRLLHLHFVETQEWAKIGETVPLHCSGIIVGLARDYAELWLKFAERVQENAAHHPGGQSPGRRADCADGAVGSGQDAACG